MLRQRFKYYYRVLVYCYTVISADGRRGLIECKNATGCPFELTAPMSFSQLSAKPPRAAYASEYGNYITCTIYHYSLTTASSMICKCTKLRQRNSAEPEL